VGLVACVPYVSCLGQQKWGLESEREIMAFL